MLWQAGVAEARGRVECVLTCRGIEGEASLSFAGLSDLLGGVLEEVLPQLVAPRRRALEVALLLVEPGTEASDAHAVGLAVLDVLRALADRGPVLLALDDAQWLDPASAGVLQIALRRLRDEPIGLLITFRGGRRLSASARARTLLRGGPPDVAGAEPWAAAPSVIWSRKSWSSSSPERSSGASRTPAREPVLRARARPRDLTQRRVLLRPPGCVCPKPARAAGRPPREASR